MSAATQAAEAAQRKHTLSHKQHVEELQQELQQTRQELADRDKQLRTASCAQGPPTSDDANGSAKMVRVHARVKHER